MKAGAPWEDQTGLARDGLFGQAALDRTSPVSYRIGAEFGHSMDYGKWLETIHGAAMGRRAGMSAADLARPEFAGPLAIIHPTIQGLLPEVKAGILRLWGGRAG